MSEERRRRRRKKQVGREKRSEKPPGTTRDGRQLKKARKKVSADKEEQAEASKASLNLALSSDSSEDEVPKHHQPLFRVPSLPGPLSAPPSSSPASSPVHKADAIDLSPRMRDASDPRALQVFYEVSKRFHDSLTVLDHKIAFIVVVHMVPTSIELLTGLESIKNGRVAGVVYKSSVQHQETRDKIEELGFKRVVISKRFVDKKILFKSPDVVNEIVRKYLKEGEKLIIIDIGGYFAKCIPYLNRIQENVIGIVEDTTNGRQKYDAVFATSKPNFPMISVDRSELKRCEDYGVGESIVHLADSELRRHMKLRLTDQEYVVVIGFGRIGSSIANHLRDKHVRNVIIYDSDPVKLALASASRFQICANKSELYSRKISVIFGATGNKSLSAFDLKNFRSEKVYVISCTSADDEFDLTGLPMGKLPPRYEADFPAYRDLKKSGIHAAYRCYQFGQGDKVAHEIFLMNEGNAINFSGHSVMGDGIRMVQAEMIVAAQKLACDTELEAQTIHALSSLEERDIATQWLAAYEGQVPRIKENLPPRNFQFLARSTDISTIEKVFFSGNFRNTNKLVLLSGNSGYGKSELARQFAHLKKEYYKLVWCLDLDVDYYKSFRDLANSLGISEKGKTYDVLVTEIASRLSNVSDFLIIFDGVKVVKRVLPILNRIRGMERGRRHVICTTNNADLQIKDFSYEPNAGEKLTVEVFRYSPELYAEFQRYYRHMSQSIFRNLVLAVGGVPVRLMHCVRYIEYTRDVEFVSSDLSPNAEVNYQAFVRHMVAKAISKDSGGLKVILIASILSDWGLKEFYSEMDAGEPSFITKKLKKMMRYGFLLRSQSKKSFFMHPITRQCIRELHEGQIKLLLPDIIKMFERLFDYNFYKNPCSPKIIFQHEQRLRFIEKFILLVKTDYPEFFKSCFELAYRLGSFYLHEHRDYRQSLEWYRLAAEINPDHRALRQDMAIDILFSSHEKTELVLAEAEGLVAHALSTPTKHPRPHQALQNADVKVTLAYVHKYRAQNSRSEPVKLEEELRLALGLLEEAIKLLAPARAKEADTATHTQRLKGLIHHLRAGIYVLLESPNQAKQEYEKAQQIRFQVLGSEHPTYARTLQKYAFVLFKQGDFEQAKAMCDEAFNIQSIHFVASHPNLEETEALRKQIDDAIYESMRPSLPADSQSMSQGLLEDEQDATMDEAVRDLNPALDAEAAAGADDGPRM